MFSFTKTVPQFDSTGHRYIRFCNMCFSKFLHISIGITLLFLCLSTALGATLPQLQFSVAQPTPTPTLPAEFDTFDSPSNTLTPNLQAPAIAELTRTAQPDETVIISGSNLTAFTGDNAGKDSRFRIFGQTTETNGILCDGSIQRLVDGFAHITLPEELPVSSMYLIWPENDNGAGYPRMVNHTESWWVGPKLAFPGDTISVFGRNLSHENGTTQAWIYLTDGSNGMWLTPTSISPNRVSFVIPTSLAVGTYEIWTHNGHGGILGWSKPLNITVEDAPNFAGGLTYDVTSFGATGDGITDDTDAINAAIIATRTLASGHGGPLNTLYFPTGVYMISNKIHVATRLRIQGAGMDQTIIRAMPGFSNYLSIGAPKYARYEDLTFDANAQSSYVMLQHRDGYDVHYTNVKFSAKRPSIYAYPLDIANSERVFITGCQIIGSGTQILTAKQVFMDNTEFFGTTSAFWLAHMRSAQDVSITNCTAQHFDNQSTDPKDYASGRFITFDSLWGTISNLHIDGNTTIDLTPSEYHFDQNSGEQIMWEEATTYFWGSPISATSNSVTFSNASDSSVPVSMMITAGTGCGQFREISNIDEVTGVVTVSTPWDVIPDSTSIVSVQFGYNNIVISNNSLDFDSRSVTSTSHIASTGIQPYSGSCNLIIDKNTIHEARTGISLWTNNGSSNTPNGEIAPCLFPLVTNNTIDTCRIGLQLTGGSSDLGYPGIARMFRGNSVSGAVDLAINIRSGPSGAFPNNIMTAFEHNTITNSSQAFNKRDDDGPLPNIFLYKNAFTLGNAPYGGSIAITLDDMMTPALGENTYTGFETMYSGNIIDPDEVSELPLRVKEIVSNGDISIDSIELWNAGTDAMPWTATSNVSWLTVGNGSGIVQDQNDSGTITVSADPSGLPDGDYAGEMTITTGSEIKKVSIKYNLLRTGIAAATVAHLQLDDGPIGTFAVDASGDGNHGTLAGSLAWTVDTPTGTGYAVQNSTSNDGVVVEHVADLDLDNDFTIAFWIKANPRSSWPRIFGHRSSGDGIEIQNNPNTNEVSVLIQTSAGSNQLMHVPGVLTGNWHHLAVTVSSGTTKAYVDGVMVKTQSYNHGNGLGNTEDIVLGARSNLTGAFAEALYDGLTIVNAILTESQITTLYQGNQP